MRTASIERKTKETNISVEVNIDGTGQYDIFPLFDTQIGPKISKTNLSSMKILWIQCYENSKMKL